MVMKTQILIRLLSAGSLAVSLSAFSAASVDAKPLFFPHPMPGYCAVAAGVVGGLALGAIAAGQPGQGCYYVRRWVTDDYGNTYRSRVLQCD